jgi:hypothetical protein
MGQTGSLKRSVQLMKEFQLVFQFVGGGLDDYDFMIKIENELIAKIGRRGLEKVDGHDMGQNEMNVFVMTDDPLRTFEKCKDVFLAHGLMDKFRAAYREVLKDGFTIIWPKDAKFVFKIQ